MQLLITLIITQGAGKLYTVHTGEECARIFFHDLDYAREISPLLPLPHTFFVLYASKTEKCVIKMHVCTFLPGYYTPVEF